MLPSGAFPTAYIAGSTSQNNLINLDSIGTTSWVLHNVCGSQLGSAANPLALILTPTTWNSEFQNAPNDGIVGVVSQLNNTTSTLTVPNIIHSPGIETLNFAAPSELDPGSGIPDLVVNLLNEATTGTDFFQ
jgi:hypothetical protein